MAFLDAGTLAMAEDAAIVEGSTIGVVFKRVSEEKAGFDIRPAYRVTDKDERPYQLNREQEIDMRTWRPAMRAKFIRMIQEQVAPATTEEADAALTAANGDVVAAIMALMDRLKEKDWRAKGLQPRDMRYLCEKFPFAKMADLETALQQADGSLVRAIVMTWAAQEAETLARDEEMARLSAGTRTLGQRFLTNARYLVKLGVLPPALGAAIERELEKQNMLSPFGQ